MLQRGPTYFKEGLRTLKRAYMLQRGPTYKSKRAYVQIKEGLQSSKRARAYVLQRGPLYFCTSKSAYVKSNQLMRA